MRSDAPCRPLVVIAMAVLMLLPGCRAPQPTTPTISPIASAPTPAPSVDAEPKPSRIEPSAELEPVERSLWRSVPPDVVPDGWELKTVRNYNLHVMLAVPPGVKIIEAGDKKAGLLVIDLGDSIVAVAPHGSYIYTGVRDVEKYLRPGSTTPPPRRRRETLDNTTAYFDDGYPVVMGRTDNALCDTPVLSRESADVAFDICSSMRVPPTGPLVSNDGDGKRDFPRAPEGAFYDKRPDDSYLDTGHFSIRVANQDCGSEEFLKLSIEREGLEPETVEREKGPAYIGRGPRTEDSHLMEARLVAPRGGRCCSVHIPNAEVMYVDEQIEYVAEICDGVGPLP